MSGFVSIRLFGFTLVIKLKNFDFESHLNTLILSDKKNRVIFEYVLSNVSFFFLSGFFGITIEIVSSWKFLIILRYIKMLYWKFCIWRTIIGCCKELQWKSERASVPLLLSWCKKWNFSKYVLALCYLAQNELRCCYIDLR